MKPLSEDLYVFSIRLPYIRRVSLVTKIQNESFFSSFKVLLEEGYLKVATNSFAKRKAVDAMSGGSRTGVVGNAGNEDDDPDNGKNRSDKFRRGYGMRHQTSGCIAESEKR